MNIIKIINLESDKKYDGFLMIKSIEEKIAKTGKKYYQIVLCDGSVDLVASIFNEIDGLKSLSGKIIYVTFKTQIYNGKFSAIIDSLDGSKEIPDELKENFITYSSNKDHYKKCIQELGIYINKIKDPEIRELCKYVFLEKFYDKFVTYPGGKGMHHTGCGGLLEHSLSLVKLALCAAEHYTYDFELDQDLLIAGGLFQDIGKVYEYDIDDYYNASYTKFISLKGHVVIGNEILYKSIDELGFECEQDKFAKLSHIILTHQGQLEFGSPVLPCTMEAVLISKLDKLDSEMKAGFTAIRSSRPDEEATQRVVPLSGVSVLTPHALIYKIKEAIVTSQTKEEAISKIQKTIQNTETQLDKQEEDLLF